VADRGGDQFQALPVKAGDGVAEADGVVGGEAGREAHDAVSPPDAGRRPPSSAVMTASQSIHAIGVPSLTQAAASTWQRK
jgi:hypothetical protein